MNLTSTEHGITIATKISDKWFLFENELEATPALAASHIRGTRNHPDGRVHRIKHGSYTVYDCSYPSLCFVQRVNVLKHNAN